MTEREDSDAGHGDQRLGAVVGQLKRAGHDPEPKRADGHRQHETMLHHSTAERDRAKHHRQHKADLVDDMRAQKAADAGQKRKEDRGGQAMDQAQPGKADSKAVETPRSCK